MAQKGTRSRGVLLTLMGISLLGGAVGLQSPSAHAGPGGTKIVGEKNASATFTRTERYTWEVEKKTTPNQAPYILEQEESVSIPFTITVRRNGPIIEEDTTAVSGQICVTNTGDLRTRNLRVKDRLELLTETGWEPVMAYEPVDLGGELEPGETRCVPYAVDDELIQIDPDLTYRNHAVASIDNYEGFVGTRKSIDIFAPVEIERIEREIDPTANLEDLIQCPEGFTCEFEGGPVGGVISGSVEVPVMIRVTNTNVPCGQTFLLENIAKLTLLTSGEELFSSATVILSTGSCEEEDLGCVKSQGWWGSSPAATTLITSLVPGVMNLGIPGYNASQLNQILDAAVSGNQLISLAHQLISAKLNILTGASSGPVSGAIAQADLLIDLLGIPPVGLDTVGTATPLGQQMSELAATLQLYNTGSLGVPYCQ